MICNLTVRKRIPVFKRWETVGPNDGVNFPLCLGKHLRVLNYGEKKVRDGRNALSFREQA